MPGLPDNTPLWLTVLVFASMVSLAWMQWRSSSRKQSSESRVDHAEAMKKIGESYAELIEQLNGRIDGLQAEITQLKHEIKKYRNWTAQLIKQLVEHNIIPIEPPDTGELMKGMK